jgi:hypothetical protein
MFYNFGTVDIFWGGFSTCYILERLDVCGISGMLIYSQM